VLATFRLLYFCANATVNTWVSLVLYEKQTFATRTSAGRLFHMVGTAVTLKMREKGKYGTPQVS